MKGSKRIPMLAIGRQGETTIDLWCNSVEGQVVVVDGIISIMTGAKTNRPCDAARLRGDDEILAALLDTKTWRRDGNVVDLLRRPHLALPDSDQLRRSSFGVIVAVKRTAAALHRWRMRVVA